MEVRKAEMADGAAAAAAEGRRTGGADAGLGRPAPSPQAVEFAAAAAGGAAAGARQTGDPWVDADSSDDELPVDDGRTEGRKAGWTDGMTDEQRADRDFYDPKADDEDERWVVEHLKHTAITRDVPGAAAAAAKPAPTPGSSAGAGAGVLPAADEAAAAAAAKKEGGKVGGVQLPPSDAVLSCPACFTLVCLDCQRHESFGNQWRALFAQNVRVLSDNKLTMGGAADASGEWYFKVLCDYCEVEVGVQDQDEVFHFFDVFPS